MSSSVATVQTGLEPLCEYHAKIPFSPLGIDKEEQEILFREFVKRFDVKKKYEELIKFKAKVAVIKAIKKRHKIASMRRIYDPMVALAFIMTGKDVDTIGEVKGRAVNVFKPEYTIFAREVLAMLFNLTKLLFKFCPDYSSEAVEYLYKILDDFKTITVREYELNIRYDKRFITIDYRVW